MRNQWQRNAVVATVLLFVCAAVYLNWRYAGNIAEGEPSAPVSGQEEDGGSTKVLGDATLVGGVPTLADETLASGEGASAPAATYFDTARLSRQQSRDNALSILREAAGQENVEQAVLDEANQAIQTLAGYTMLEGQIENLVVAKGYADCVAFMGENSISVVVSAAEDGLQTEDVAKITDIVLSETSYTAYQIKIMAAVLGKTGAAGVFKWGVSFQSAGRRALISTGKEIQPKNCIRSPYLRILSMFSKASKFFCQAFAGQIWEESRMKATGIVRRIDDLGRVVIPKEIRRTMRIREGDPSLTMLEQWERFCGGMLGLERRMGWGST